MTLTTKSGRKIKLWQLQLAIAIVGVGLACLPERIGVPTFLAIESMLILTFLVLLAIVVYRRLTKPN